LKIIKNNYYNIFSNKKHYTLHGQTHLIFLKKIKKLVSLSRMIPQDKMLWKMFSEHVIDQTLPMSQRFMVAIILLK